MAHLKDILRSIDLDRNVNYIINEMTMSMVFNIKHSIWYTEIKKLLSAYNWSRSWQICRYTFTRLSWFVYKGLDLCMWKRAWNRLSVITFLSQYLHDIPSMLSQYTVSLKIFMCIYSLFLESAYIFCLMGLIVIYIF